MMASEETDKLSIKSNCRWDLPRRKGCMHNKEMPKQNASKQPANFPCLSTIVSMLLSIAMLSTPLILSMTAVLLPRNTYGAALLFTQEARIVEQTKLSGVCTDYTGAERADLEEWTSSAGACDKVICHVEPSGNYTVTRTCRPRESYENPDETNCEWISNTTASYPDCCPELSCATSAPLVTVDPLSCFDLGSAFACGVWYNLTTGCNDTLADTFNTSRTYCRDTCGLC